MKINNVVLYNFSSYAGQTMIDLHTTPEKNVVLIGGNNGAGKTSLFTAIKLALYGPLCFHFQGNNHHYTGKIRELINRDAFLCEEVKAFVELSISLFTDSREVEYQIHREWTVVDRKIVETYSVHQGGVQLGPKDLDFFQNYLFTIIPPNLFDFFLFDGEEIADFFATGNYSQYIRNAVLTLSGYDTFSVIQRFCKSFVDHDSSDNEMDHATELLADCLSRIEQQEAWLTQAEIDQRQLLEQEKQLQSELQALEERFRKSGGISHAEREKLEGRVQELDRVKSDCSRRIRGFVEDLMPLFIMRDVVERAHAQISNETAFRQYRATSALLSPENLLSIILTLPRDSIKNPEQLAEVLSKGITAHVKPACSLDDFQEIHALSDEQEQLFAAVRARICGLDTQQIVQLCREREAAANEYDKLVAYLRSSLPADEVLTYQNTVDSISTAISRCAEEIQHIEAERVTRNEQLAELRATEQRLRKNIQLLSRNQTAYVYTGRIAAMMEQMIAKVAQTKFREVETLTLQMFSRIIRKDNYIQLVELDQDFNIHLFKKQHYTIGELELLAQNVGVETLEYRVGNAGKRIIMQELGFANDAEFSSYFSKRKARGQLSVNSTQELGLYSRIELNQLSKGEKQVFILALYWAIIKTSKQTVPFVIDTPFARIDTEHREQISRLFFTEISHQVIVLSTDEEVVGSYYHALVPHVAHEYKLEYDVQTGRTSINNGYFDEVTA